MTNRRAVSWTIFNTEIRGTFLVDDAQPIAAQRRGLIEAVERSTGHKVENVTSMGSSRLGDQLPNSLFLFSTQVQRLLKTLQAAGPVPPDERAYARALISVECIDYADEPNEYSAKPIRVERQLVAKVVYENSELAVFKLDKPRQLNHGFGPTLPQRYCFASLDQTIATERGKPVFPYYAEHLEVEKNLVRGWFKPPAKRHSVCWRPVEAECVVCLHRNATQLSSDCKGAHFLGCATCVESLSICPICREPIRIVFSVHEFGASKPESQGQYV